MLALFVTGQTLNIYSQIGMILLIGLMTKNGILIVEFSNQLRERGYSVRDAVIEASVLRLRPILMTSIAMIGGAIPLAWSTGAGAEARNAIGSVIVGGVDGLDAADGARGALDLPAARRLHQARHLCERDARQAARADRLAPARRTAGPCTSQPAE